MMCRIRLVVAVACLTVCCHCVRAAAAGAPMFVRVTVLEAEESEGPFDAMITITVMHRPPSWYPNRQLNVGQLPLGQPSAWIDLSKTLDAKGNVVTAVLSLVADGKPIKSQVRARVELARKLHGDKTTPLASIEVEDPGGVLGFVMPERAVADEDVPARFASIAQVAQRHLAASKDFGLEPEETPKQFIAVTRALRHSSYTDPKIHQTEVKAVLRMGYNTLVDISPDLADKMGVPYIGGADYRPPGVEGKGADEQTLLKHYQGRGKQLIEKYGSTNRLRALAMSDEPNWSFPSTAERLNNDPETLKRFHAYLRERGLTPKLLGQDSWEAVRPGAFPAADVPLSERRIWYHTVRFSDRDSARRYALAARALRTELGEQVLGFVNWNNPGIFYCDLHPWRNAPINCSHDWFNFSRARGNTCLWLGPGISEGGGWYRSTFRTWSLMLTLLRSAANQGVGRFGAYVHHNMIPDERGFEVALSIMAIAGHGGAGYNSYIWGPHYAFTEYMWSEKFGHYEHVADANRLIGRSEHLMIGAKPPKAQVALLWPITSMMYDLNMRGYWTYNRDFLVEMQHVWFALNHHNIPADFVDETMVQQGALDKYKILYLTGPNLERRSADAISQWVDRGGRLWTCAGAAMRDEYNQPMDVFDKVLGVTSRKLVRRIDTDYSPKDGLRQLSSLAKVKMSSAGTLGDQAWNAYGSRAAFDVAGGEVVGHFDNGKPAVVRNRFGRGGSLHFATMPGLAYSRGATETPWQPTIDYPPRIAKLITALPTELAVPKPATTSLPFVEAAVLRSDKGIAVTLLNWSGKPVKSLEVKVFDVGAFDAVRSARHGKLPYQKHNNTITVKLSMPRVIDVVMFSRGS